MVATCLKHQYGQNVGPRIRGGRYAGGSTVARIAEGRAVSPTRLLLIHMGLLVLGFPWAHLWAVVRRVEILFVHKTIQNPPDQVALTLRALDREVVGAAALGSGDWRRGYLRNQWSVSTLLSLYQDMH